MIFLMLSIWQRWLVSPVTEGGGSGHQRFSSFSSFTPPIRDSHTTTTDRRWSPARRVSRGATGESRGACEGREDREQV